MKMLVAATVLAVAIASPALAQTQTQSARAKPNGMEIDQTVGRSTQQPRSEIPPNESARPGEVIGTDPDANVRLELRRDHDNSD